MYLAITLIILKSFICFFLGAIFGNILTTFFFRVPRGIPINGIEQPPMCSVCNVRLKYPYYGPFFQALFKGLKCSVCGAKIPFIYTLIELASGLFSLIYFLLIPFDGLHIVKFLGILVFSLIFLLQYKTGKLYEKTNWIFLTTSLIVFSYNNSNLLEELVFHVAYAITPCLILKLIVKKVDILELCLIVTLSIVLREYLFILSSAIFLILRFFKQKFAFLPFLLMLIF